MTNLMDWQGVTGQSWADEWRRTDRSFAPLTARLLETISAEPGERVLDIGCGAGELALAVAAARPGAQVLGLDISPELVRAAQLRAGPGNVRFALGDAAGWSDPAFVPDLLVSRHGVMFFGDPPAAFAHLAAASAPDARLVFSCFRSARLNSWAAAIARLLPASGGAPADPHAPGPFAFADPVHVRAVLAAGWTDIAFEEVDFAYVAGEGEDAVNDAAAFFSRIGPFAAAMRSLPEAERPALREAVRGVIEQHREESRIVFRAAAWIVSARRR
jgi:SAM-dependent methyltransferase